MSGPVGGRRVVDREQVVRGACRFFLRHATVDMPALAQELAISRATLYRVVGSRDQLLGDALWRLADGVLARARGRRTGSGVEGVLQITRCFTADVRVAEPFRAFLRTEPVTAVRLLTAGQVHRRAVAAQRRILLEEGARDPGSPLPRSPADLDESAYLYVRVVESALYAELLSGLRTGPARVERAARAVLLTR